jgi:flagellar hook-associated protein 3 FlgL
MYTNLKGLDSAQERLYSQREVHRPSDDPVRVVTSLALRSDLGEVTQYQGNIGEAQSWFEITESALGNATDILQRIRELAGSGATDTTPQESRDALAEEVNQLKEQLIQIANSTHGSRYIFGGTRTDAAPYNAATEGWEGNEGDIQFEIATGVTIQVNLPGKELFVGNTTDGAIPVLTKLANSLEDPSKKGADISPLLGEIDKILDRFIARRGEIGAKVNRMEMSLDRLGQAEITGTELLSKAEDADIAKAIIDLKSQENAYRVTLAAGARIMMPTLMDFLS